MSSPQATVGAHQRNGMIRDTATMFSREFMPVLREPLVLIFSMGQPLLFLFLFGSLLDGNPGTSAGGSSWQWFVPGILVMMCLTGPLAAGHSMLVELTSGSMERLLVTPVNRTAMLIGRTLKEFIILLVQAVLIIGLAVPLGFRLYPVAVLTGLALLVVFGTGLGAFSFVLAIKSQPSGALFWIVTQLLLFPLMLLSGVLLPMDFAPEWLKIAAGFNPVTYIVDAERALFAGRFDDISLLYGVIAAFAVAAAGLFTGNRVMRRGI